MTQETNLLVKHDKLRKLESNRLITIGIKRDYANTVWGRSFLGWVANFFTIVLVIITFYFFIKNGLFIGLALFVITAIYVLGVQRLASIIIRARMLRHGHDSLLLFQEAYHRKMVTIRNNKTGEVIFYPKDWVEWLGEIQQ